MKDLYHSIFRQEIMCAIIFNYIKNRPKFQLKVNATERVGKMKRLFSTGVLSGITFHF